MMKRFALAALIAGVAPAYAQDTFDGSWAMSAATQSGTCSTYSFEVGINNGVIQTPPGVPVAGSGRVTPKGAVAVNFSTGSDVISASGTARGAQASGRWTAPTLNCAGTWQAQRR